MRHDSQPNCKLILVTCLGTAFVLDCLTLSGCRTPRRDQTGPSDDRQTLTAAVGRLEVREDHYASGALWRRTEGRVLEDGTFVPQGLQTILAEDGHKLSELTYVDGVRDGLRTAYYPGGEIRSQGRYIAGREDGPWIVWSRDGRKLQEITFDHGAYHGMYREWHGNGQLKYEVEFVRGLKQGTETWWDEAGSMSRRTEYVDGVAQP